MLTDYPTIANKLINKADGDNERLLILFIQQYVMDYNTLNEVCDTDSYDLTTRLVELVNQEEHAICMLSLMREGYIVDHDDQFARIRRLPGY